MEGIGSPWEMLQLNFVPRTDPWSFFGAFNVPTNASGTLISKADATAANRQYQYTIDGTTLNRFAALLAVRLRSVDLLQRVLGLSDQHGEYKRYWFKYIVNETADLSNAGVGVATLPAADVMVGGGE